MEYISGTQIVGHDIDLMDALAAEMGVTVVYTNVPWVQLFGGLGTGEFEAVISTVSISPVREEEVDFTLPYVTFNYGGPDDNVGIAVQQGDSVLRRQMNEALWELRNDGTLATIIAAIAADKPTWNPRMPDWPFADPSTEATLIYTDSEGTSTSIQVPSGAVTETLLLAYTPLDWASPPSGLSFANRAFDLDVFRDGAYHPSGLALSVPATITVHYTDVDVAGFEEASLVLHRRNKGTSGSEDAACGPYDRHPEENWLAVPVCHLSRFALFGSYTGLIIATSADWPPMEYISGTQIVGHDVDLMDALAAEMGVTVVYTNVPWGHLFGGLETGEFDAVISTVSISPGREEGVDFTLPYVTFSGGGSDDNVGIVVQQGDSVLRRQMNEALWGLRNDGTLATIIAAIAADEPTWSPRLPDWHFAGPGSDCALIYTDTQGIITSIRIPGDAVSETVLLAYTPLGAIAPPSGFSFANRAFDLDVYSDGAYLSPGLVLSVPATITVQYTDTDLAGLDETLLVLQRWTEATDSWEDAACGAYNRHPDENWLAAPVCHLSRFALLGKYSTYLPLVMR
jgi:ABC-type amino acid transport substrate-binding protein